MAANKAKVNTNQSQATQDNQTNKNAGARSFKIYKEDKVVNVDKKMVKIGPTFSWNSPKCLLTSISPGYDQLEDLIEKTVAHENYLVPSSLQLKASSDQMADVKYVENNDKSNGSLTNTMRIALADVSNFRSNSSAKKVLHDGSKPMKRKIDKRVSLQGVSMGRLNKIEVSSRKSLVKMQINSNERVGNAQIADKVLVKGQKTSFDRSTKIYRQSSDFSCAINKKTAKVSMVSSRRSLPVLKRVNGENATNSKGNAESSVKIKERVGIPVGRKALLHGSNAKSYHLRSRASDGFIMTGQANMKTQALSVRSINPTSKILMKASDAPRKTSHVKVLLSKTEKTLASSLSKNTVDEAILGKVSADKTCDLNPRALLSKTAITLASSPSKNTVDEAILGKVSADKTCDLNPRASANILSKRKAGRRRSYTSLLMTGSKLVEEYTSVTKQDKLPSIDNEHNQLEVAEYVEEIYQYYWVMEAESPPVENYLSKQMDIVPQMRGILINWLNEVHFKFDLMHETLFLSIMLFDRYLSQVITKKDDLQLVGLTALLLASKYEDFWHPRVTDLISISAESYTREQMLEMEMLILKKLKFRLNIPTPYLFMLRFLKAAQSDTKLDHLAFYLIELCLVEYEALKFKSSLLCASAIFIARCTLKISPYWTSLLSKHTHYEVSQLSDCAEMILKFQRSAKLGRLKVTFEKYMKPDFSSVAAMKPLDALPS